MNKYKCISSFLSTKSKRYSYGATIGQTEYSGLTAREQRYFRKEESYRSGPDGEGSNPLTNYSASILSADTYDTTSDTTPDTSSSDSDSSSDFSGYDGGDSGGGGSSGDYDSSSDSSDSSSSDSGGGSDD